MMLRELIERASERDLRAEDFDAAARSAGMSPSDLTDVFARAVADGFRNGALPWAVGDGAMNWLFSYGIMEDGEGVLSPLATRVFEAFDEGEYTHFGEPEDRQGESRTRTLLEWALTGDEAQLAPFRPETTLPLVRAAVVSLAKRALDGEVTTIATVRELVWGVSRMRLSNDDPDVAALDKIEQRTAHLPLGSARSTWAPEALAKKDVEIAAAEKWAQEFGRPVLLSIIQRIR
jgi:hypothetical protein